MAAKHPSGACRRQRLSSRAVVAGFQVSTGGRFWVSTEETFAGDQLVIALGVTATGEKHILGLVQTASENKRVIASFELGDRGFPLDQPLLAVLDGARGLRAAVRDVFGDIAGKRTDFPCFHEAVR